MNLKRIILSLMWSLCLLPLMAAGTDEPIITFKTHRYDEMGEENQITFSLMPRAAVRTTQIDVDFGFGRKTYTIDYDGYVAEDDSTETLIGGTTIAGTVSAEGVVRVYGTATDIDYLDIHGSEVYDLDISQLTNLVILSLAHNEINKLDVSMMCGLQYLDLKDNPFDEGLVIGNTHPGLYYLNLNKLGDNALASGTVDLSNFSELRVFTAWDTKCLKTLDVTHNTKLQQISIDNSGVTSLNVRSNPNLLILNVSDCGFNDLDVSSNGNLVELYVDNEGQATADRKLASLDVTNNPYLQRIFCNGNMLTTLNISKQNNLVSLYAANNYLTELKGLEKVDSLAYLDVSVNCFDFATFPEVDPLTYFYYVLQRDMPVGTEYKVGSVLDMSSRVIRGEEVAECVLAIVPSSGIEDPILLNEGVDYSYADGKITFLKPQCDHVVAYFYNPAFPDVTLKTTEFWVRSEEDFGTLVPQISFFPKKLGSGCKVNFTVDVERSDSYAEEKIVVNFGGNDTKEYTLTEGNTFVVEGTAVGAVTISGRIEMPLTSFVLNNTELDSIDLTRASYLQKLDLQGDSLSTIDLSWNNLLHDINLSHNKLDSLELSGVNDAHHKNVLTHVVARGNNLVYFNDIVGITIEYLDLSDNKFSEIDFTEYSALTYLNLSNNLLTSLSIDDCTELEELHIENNLFRFSTLPQLSIASYNYVPQQILKIAARSMLVSLGSEAKVGDVATTFVWKEANTGAVLVEGTDYTVTDAKFIFLEPAVGKDVYCELTNAVFPDFNAENPYKTTTVHVMGKPNYTVATFSTPVGGEHATLSFGSVEDNTFIYIDWGNDELVEYPLQTMYTLFEVETIEAADVKVYSYDAPDGGIRIFSFDGVTMSDIDVSKLSSLYCLTLCGASLEEIDLSKNPDLTELNMEGNNLSSIDLSHNPKLYSLILANNKLEEIDLSKQNDLGWLVLSDNKFSSFEAPNLSQLYALVLTRNNLTEIDLSYYPSLRQLAVAENQFSNIDMSQHTSMDIVDLSQNKFTLATLPLPTSNYMLYTYGNQAPVEVECVEGHIDLSDMAEIAGVASIYYWFEGELQFYYDEEDNLQLYNNEYIEGEDFEVEGGVTSFYQSQSAVTGYIYNELFPNIILLTKTIAVTGTSAIDEVQSAEASSVRYNLYGQRIEKEEGLTICNGVKVLK